MLAAGLAALKAAYPDVIRARDAGAQVRHLVARPMAPVVARDAGPRRDTGATPSPGAFGFPVHDTEEEDILRSDPSFRGLSEAERSEWQEWVKRLGAGVARRLPPVRSRTGAVAEGCILSVPMLPEDVRGPFRTLPPELCWGCLGETMLLAMAREKGDFSIGSRLSLGDADRLSGLARRHGFTPAPPQCYGARLDAGDLDRFGRTVAEVRDARRAAAGPGGWARLAQA